MIGWWIVIAAQTPEERDAAATEARRAAILAQWEVGPGGLDWVAELVKAGKANQISGGGYPNRYTAKAGDVLPLLISGSPAHIGPAIIGDDDVMSANWNGKVEVHAEKKMAACAPDRLLTIDAWDQSSPTARGGRAEHAVPRRSGRAAEHAARVNAGGRPA